MNDFPVILFPHSHLPDRELKRLLSFFGPLTVFQPWLMERPVLSEVTSAEPPCRIARPPERLEADARLKALLSEYRNWVSQHHESSRMDFIKAVRGRGSSEGSTWDIRRMLRGEPESTFSPAEDQALRWHLLLHLAQDVEDQRREADRLLRAAQDRASPLKDVLGEEVSNGESILRDLPAFDTEPVTSDDQLESILAAWVGLFGPQLEADRFLITNDPRIAATVSTYRSNRGDGEEAAVRFRVPDLSSREFEGLEESKAELFENSRVGELRSALLDYGQAPGRDLVALAELSAEVELSVRWGTEKAALVISVMFPDPTGSEASSDSLSGFLAGRGFILVQPATRS